MIPETRMALDTSIRNTLAHRAFSYTAVWMCMANRPRMATADYVHSLGGLAEPCILSVPFRKLAWLTPPW